MDAIVALRKKERSILQNRKEQRIARHCQRQVREEEEDDKDGSDNEYSCPFKIRRVKEKSYDHIDTIGIMKNGYLSVPDQMWAWDLSPEEKKFVI
eukprot:3321043-Ditylum_brightwellii.AAC.1